MAFVELLFLIAFGALAADVWSQDGRGASDDPDDVVPTDGADLLRGTAGGDSIAGLEGADTIFGEGGDDLLSTLILDDLANFNEAGNGAASLAYGGAGNDTIYAMNMGDSVFGNEGDDQVELYATTVTAYGGAGNDILQNGDFLADSTDNVTLEGGAGDDTIAAFGTDMRIRGDDDDDDLTVGDGDGSVVNGGAGDDVLRYVGDGGSGALLGGSGNDTLFSGTLTDFAGAGAGNNLDGGDGDDVIDMLYQDGSVLTGGLGSDIFRLQDAFDTSLADVGRAGVIIRDFTQGADRIEIGTPDGADTLAGVRIDVDTASNQVRLFFSTIPSSAADFAQTGEAFVFDRPAIILDGVSAFDAASLAFVPLR